MTEINTFKFILVCALVASTDICMNLQLEVFRSRLILFKLKAYVCFLWMYCLKSLNNSFHILIGYSLVKVICTFFFCFIFLRYMRNITLSISTSLISIMSSWVHCKHFSHPALFWVGIAAYNEDLSEALFWISFEFLYQAGQVFTNFVCGIIKNINMPYKLKTCSLLILMYLWKRLK